MHNYVQCHGETGSHPFTLNIKPRFTPLFLARLRTDRIARELEERLAQRKRIRTERFAARSQAARLGWKTRRASHV